MTKDFKDRPQTASALNDPITWLLLGLAIGLVVGLVYLLNKPTTTEAQASPATGQANTVASQQPVTSSKPLTEDAHTKLENTIASQLEKSIERDDSPEFRFYAMLPSVEVEVPVAIAHEPKPAPKPQEAPKKAPEPKVASKDNGSRYILQVGAFRTLDDSNAMLKRVSSFGINAYTEKAQVKDASWHRVRIGPITGIEQAKQLRSRLSSQGITSYMKKI